MARTRSDKVETDAYASMVSRMIRAYGRRVGNGDDVDLERMLKMRAELDQAIADAVHGQRATGRSWTDIARAAGITRQSAHERWNRA